MRLAHCPSTNTSAQKVAPKGRRSFSHKKVCTAAGKVIKAIGVIVTHQRRSFQSVQKSQSPTISIAWRWNAPMNKQIAMKITIQSKVRSSRAASVDLFFILPPNKTRGEAHCRSLRRRSARGGKVLPRHRGELRWGLVHRGGLSESTNQLQHARHDLQKAAEEAQSRPA